MDGFPVVCEEKVRYGDLDPFGHLNNTVFFQFFEQTRLAYMTRLGLYGANGRGSQNVILAETSCRFVAEGHYDDRVTCGARVLHLGNRSLEMEHRLERGGALMAEGRRGPGLVRLREEGQRATS